MKSPLSFPLRHVSIRVPWHDRGWDGTVCGELRFNTACLKLKGIAQSKNEDEEEKVCGKTITKLVEEGPQRYLMTGERGERGARTIIVDKCSMLTEEMMAALIESLSKVDRRQKPWGVRDR